MIRAKDVMKRRVLTLGPDTTVAEATRLFQDAGISGAPVVGEDRKVLGVVSRSDLLRRHQQSVTRTVPAFYQEGTAVVMTEGSPSPGQVRVVEVMTPAVLSAEEGTPLPDLARFMLRHQIHRVVITSDGRLRGLVTAMDLVGVLARKGHRPAGRRPRRRRAAGRGL